MENVARFSQFFLLNDFSPLSRSLEQANVFLAGKIKSVHDRQPSTFGPFYRPKWRISLPFHILQLGKSLPFLYLKPKKSYLFRVEPPHIGHYVELKRAISDLRNEHTYLMHAHASLYTDVPPWLFKKLNEFILIRSVCSVLNQTL